MLEDIFDGILLLSFSRSSARGNNSTLLNLLALKVLRE